MSWLFSRALVAEYSAGECSDGEPCAPSNASPMPQAFLPPDKMTAFSRPSRFGMTFGPLMDTLGAELLTWFLAASRAKTSASPAKAPASEANAPACGDQWRGSLARFDHASRSWKTAQRSLLEDSDECSPIWPRSGMTAAGQCLELTTLALRTVAPDSGSWPTPTATLGTNGGRVTPRQSKEGVNLIEAVSNRTQWPTPTVTGNDNKAGLSPQSGDGLATAVARVATPIARDWRSGKASQATHDRNSRPLSEQIGGCLNPTWVEWLMAWPLGWTDLKPLETDKYHCAPQAHGGY
jgi:hypothetical protein